MNHQDYKDKLKIEEFSLHVPLGKENFAAWVGASIFGATDAISTRSFTREQYSKEKSVPDWANLRFNTVYNEERQGWQIFNFILFLTIHVLSPLRNTSLLKKKIKCFARFLCSSFVQKSGRVPFSSRSLKIWTAVQFTVQIANVASLKMWLWGHFNHSNENFQ